MPRIRTHPGEVLTEEYMIPLDISVGRLALDLNVSVAQISELIRSNEPGPMTADIALRLARYLRTSPLYWMNLQNAYDLSKIEAEKGAEIAQVGPFRNHAG
jgi:antitoxin HigA-1